MIRINLVPAEILAKAKEKELLFRAALAAAATCMFLLFLSWFHYSQMTKEEKSLSEAQAKLKKLEVIVSEVDKLESEAKAIRQRLSVISTLIKGRTFYPYFMSDFVRSVPFDIQVKNLSTTGGGSQMSPLKLNISAEAAAQDDIAEWMLRLKNSGRFSNIDLGAITRVDSEQKTYNFTLTALYTNNTQ